MDAKPGSFVGELRLTPEDKHKGQVETTSDDRQVWALAQAFGYRTLAGDTITAPAGMSTDLASIPQALRGILAPDGPWVRAAIIHDLLYQTKGTAAWHGHVGRSRAAAYTREEADHVLDEAMASLGVPTAQRVAIFEGVRLGGAGGWGH